MREIEAERRAALIRSVEEDAARARVEGVARARAEEAERARIVEMERAVGAARGAGAPRPGQAMRVDDMGMVARRVVDQLKAFTSL